MDLSQPFRLIGQRSQPFRLIGQRSQPFRLISRRCRVRVPPQLP